MSLESVIKVVNLGTKHQIVLKIVKAECMEITVVYLVVIASNQNNATI